MESTPAAEAPNDGVKLLEEVFGSKTSVSSTGTSDVSSNGSSAEAKEEVKS